jgi:hypothetical protein
MDYHPPILTVGVSCIILNVTRSSFYVWREAAPGFRVR